ncbi:MAG TPA: hypothetical protein VEA41_14710 [Salinarimonas sp.]|nr:hypothetical protein [Salinarimonas sp.]
MHPTPHAPPDPALSTGDLLRAAWRGWRPLAAWVAASLAAALAVIALATPRYVAEAVLLIEPQEGAYTQAGTAGWSPPYVGEDDVATAVLAVRSRDLAREAVRRLGLAGHPAFDPGRSAGEEALVERYLDALTVSAEVLTSRVVRVTFRAADPDLAASGANVAAALFLDRRGAAAGADAGDAAEWLRPTIERLRAELAAAEAAVEAQRAAAGLVAGTRGTVLAQGLGELNGRLAAEMRAGADAQARAGILRDLMASGRTMEVAGVADDPGIRRLAERRAGLQAGLAREGRALSPGHPRIEALRARLDDVDGALRAAAERAARALQAEAEIAASRVEALRAAIDEQARAVGGTGAGHVRLRVLEREAAALRAGLDAHLARLAEAQARQGGRAEPGEARLVSRAVPPARAHFPNRPMLLVLALACGLMLGFLGLAIRELLGGARLAGG